VRRKSYGMTLIELMTVMVVIAILASIAVPSYRGYILRANRSEAKVQLMTVAGALEKCYTRFNAYDDGAGSCTVVATLEGTGLPSENGLYRVTGTVERGTYTLTATPQANQATDTGCGNFTLDHTNAKGRSGTKPVSECWSR
jgi:type IV pilus assembly protein PilE